MKIRELKIRFHFMCNVEIVVIFRHNIYIYIYIYTYIYILYVYVYVYGCMYACMYACMHVCMYVDNGISYRNHCSFCVYPGIYIRILETKTQK